MEDHKGWYRRNLPHLDIPGKTQYLTFRLADSIPQSVLETIRDEMKGAKGNLDRIREEGIQYYLDQGSSSCVLREPPCAKDALQYLNGKMYELNAWVVMPSHVHFMAFFEEGQTLPKALHSLKSYTGHEIVKLHPELNPVWQQETFDRFIRNEDHFQEKLTYIHENPVAAKLCLDSSDYPWSSAFGPDL